MAKSKSPAKSPTRPTPSGPSLLRAAELARASLPYRVSPRCGECGRTYRHQVGPTLVHVGRASPTGDGIASSLCGRRGEKFPSSRVHALSALAFGGPTGDRAGCTDGVEAALAALIDALPESEGPAIACPGCMSNLERMRDGLSRLLAKWASSAEARSKRIAGHPSRHGETRIDEAGRYPHEIGWNEASAIRRASSALAPAAPIAPAAGKRGEPSAKRGKAVR